MSMVGEKTAREVCEASGEELMNMLFVRVAGHSEIANLLDCSYKFILHGKQGGVWILNGGASPALTVGMGESDCTFECSTELLGRMILGISNPQAEYLTSELKVRGDEEKALRFVRVWDR